MHQSCSTCPGASIRKSDYTKNYHSRNETRSLYQDEYSYQGEETGTRIEGENNGRKILAESSCELTFYDTDPCKIHVIAGRETTIPALIVDVNASFANSCIPFNVIVWYSKINKVLTNCCGTGKCIGWVVNFLEPRKDRCDKSCRKDNICGTLWSLIIMKEGELLLRSVACAKTIDGETDPQLKCRSHDTFSFVKSCCEHYNSDRKLVTHILNGQMTVVGACGGFRYVVGSAIVWGTLGYDQEYDERKFYKQLLCKKKCNGNESPSCVGFPATIRYELCLLRDCPEDTD